MAWPSFFAAEQQSWIWKCTAGQLWALVLLIGFNGDFPARCIPLTVVWPCFLGFSSSNCLQWRLSSPMHFSHCSVTLFFCSRVGFESAQQRPFLCFLSSDWFQWRLSSPMQFSHLGFYSKIFPLLAYIQNYILSYFWFQIISFASFDHKKFSVSPDPKLYSLLA